MSNSIFAAFEEQESGFEKVFEFKKSAKTKEKQEDHAKSDGKFNIYEKITNRIVEQLKQGKIPWRKPWIGGGKAVRHRDGKPYKLINQLLLEYEGEYITYRQCQAEGGRIKKGEKANLIVEFFPVKKTAEEIAAEIAAGAKPGEIDDTKRFVLRYENVFNVLTQCEGITPKYFKDGERTNINSEDRIEAAENLMKDYLNRSHVTLENRESEGAFYAPNSDLVVLPNFEQFTGAPEYYSTAFHELTHSTGHAKRLNRFEHGYFGSTPYSKEELVAEIGSAAIMNRVGLETGDTFKNSTAYIQSWLEKLQNDDKFVFQASAQADKAMKLILNE